MAPSMWYSFGDVGSSFGSEMGTITVNASDPSQNATKGAAGSKEQDLGRKLMRGSWNAELWGVLEDERSKGLEEGTDWAFDKSIYFISDLSKFHLFNTVITIDRLSGMWGTSTPLQQFLQDNSITTLFFGGVNTDQCVYGTLLDSAYTGYDTILVTDISATVSPESATEMVVYNSGCKFWWYCDEH
jgi:nicotinamidase-related amidase